jgi:predicted glycoside hydrolase/deacetylase ChbG (UPF0249 family)
VRLILHSDDFGLHPAVNAAIVTCARTGVLSSASILANGPAVEEALVEAGEVPELGIGVHLNIVRGKPLSDPAAIPTLVDRGGRFLNSLSRLWLRSRLGRLCVEEICEEFKRQVHHVLQRGIVPSHLDSEKHSHILLPEAAEALSRVGAEFGLGKVRQINESALARTLRQGPGACGWRQRAKLHLLEKAPTRGGRQWTGWVSTDYSLGVCAAGCPSPSEARQTLEALFHSREDHSVEWFFHLGYELDYRELRGDFGSFALTSSRSREVAFLLDEGTVSLLRRYRSQVISFRDL